MLVTLGAAVRVGESQLLSPLSAAFAPGQVTAILGPNGAGKSTLLSLLSGQRKPSCGEVWVNGKLLGSYRAAELALLRAVLPQDSAVAFDFRVQDVVELGRYPHRLQATKDERGVVQAALDTAEVGHLASRIFNTLSGGEKARAQLARALAQIWEPLKEGRQRWLLLDEPTAALDLAHQHKLMRTVQRWARAQGVGVVAVLHDLNLALRYADQVLVLKAGRQAATGRPCDVLHPALIREVWGVQCERVNSSDGTAQLLMQET